jgi:FkbM family methyltransferase
MGPMPGESKKIPFDQYNVSVSSATSSEAVEMKLVIPCEDGALADVTIKIESPVRVVAEDGSKSYKVNVVTKEEVTNADRIHTEGGQKRRSDGLYWEIPPNFPEAAVALLEHEPKVKEFLMGQFKENRTFVDVGANVGGYSVRAASWDMKVYAFEPNPDNLALLRRNIEINHASVNVLPFALGAKEGRARLSPNGGVSRIIKDEGIEVEMRTLDSFDLAGADLLKVDVEGYELEVLRGARKTLEKFHPVIMIEMHYWIGAESEAELFEILLGLGYRLEYIDRYALGRHLSAFPQRTDSRPSAPKAKQAD